MKRPRRASSGFAAVTEMVADMGVEECAFGKGLAHRLGQAGGHAVIAVAAAALEQDLQPGLRRMVSEGADDAGRHGGSGAVHRRDQDDKDAGRHDDVECNRAQLPPAARVPVHVIPGTDLKEVTVRFRTACVRP
jgi:hypothetical protein